MRSQRNSAVGSTLPFEMRSDQIRIPHVRVKSPTLCFALVLSQFSPSEKRFFFMQTAAYRSLPTLGGIRTRRGDQSMAVINQTMSENIKYATQIYC